MSQNESLIKSNKFMLGTVIGILVAINLGYMSSILINSGALFAQIFGSLPVFIYWSISLSLTGIVTASLAGFVFGRMIQKDTITNKKIKITGISLGLLSLLSIKSDVFLSFIEFIFGGNFSEAFIVLLPIIIVSYAGYKGAAYGYMTRKEVTDITGIPRADQYKELKKTDSLAEGIGAISLFGMTVVQFLIYILLPVLIAAILLGWKSARDIWAVIAILIYLVVPLCLIIAFIAFKANPFKGIWRKIAALVSLIPGLGIIPALYYFVKCNIKENYEGWGEDFFLAIICGILFILSLILYYKAMTTGWIGYCVGNEICINGISIKWAKIFI